MSIIPLDKAVKFYELKEEIYRLLTLYYCTDELDAVNDRKAKELIEAIQSNSATPDKVVVNLEETKL